MRAPEPVAANAELLAAFAAFLGDRTGLHYPEDRWPDMERAVRQMAREQGFTDPASCMRYFLSIEPSQRQVETLASYLTIGETYFFREPRNFEVLAQQVLPPLLAARQDAGRTLRIWSAACSTGEEAYSMAILLDQLIPDIDKWHITLLATDINPRSLRRAQDGLYGEWSFRGLPAETRNRYFTRHDNRYEVIPRIKRMVTFAYHNLAVDQYPSVLNNTNAMDIIFCRNVLMYFSPAVAKQVAGNLSQSLVDGGWLVAAAVEANSELFAPLSHAGIDGATLYRKHPIGAPILTPVPPPLATTPITQPSAILQDPPAQPPPSPPSIDGEALYAEACALYAQGDFASAIALLDAQPATVAADPRCLGLLARLYANEGRLEAAAALCDRAILIDKVAPEYHYLLAMIRQELGQTTEAMQSLRRALFLNPDFVLAHFALARLAYAAGKLDEARRHYRNAGELLRHHDPAETLPESDGLTAGRLTEIIRIASAEVRQ